MVEAFTLGDFLVESRCTNGHASSACFRGYRKLQVENVAAILRQGRCAWLLTSDGARCGASSVHSVHELGPSDADVAKIVAFRNSDTLPGMQAVETPPGPRSSYPPPPPEDDGPMVAGD